MKIEEEIKQKQFSGEYQKLVVNILYTASWISLQSNQRLKPFNISQEQFNVLRILRGQHPKASSVQLIVERMIDKSSNASRIVEKLRQKGLVERRECLKDRRLVDVSITQKGMDLLMETDKDFNKFEKSFGGIDVNEAELLNSLLDKLRN